MSTLTRRVSDLEAAAPPGGCRDAFHATWHVLHADEATGELPPRPRCPTCGRPAENVIEVVFELDPRAVTVKTLRGVSMNDL